MTDNIRYVHEEVVHNFKAANEVVPYILELLDPKSVVDVGCGIGTWLKVFQDNGIDNILGIDGDYVDKSLLKIDKNKFIDYDLEKFYKSEIKFDLAISLEVAEHLSELSADVFIQTLIGLSNNVIFSAAIPFQGGQNHINEKEPTYWIRKFEKEGYKLLDVFRPIFWDNKNVDSWYRQNILFFTKNQSVYNKLNSLENYCGKHLVHPDFFSMKEGQLNFQKREMEKILRGKKVIKFYFKILLKALKFKIKQRLHSTRNL